jgi:uncharacterized protein YbjT (DUF2867 family)
VILVTAATGTVGSEVVARLADADVDVRAASRDADAASRRLGHDVEYVAFDFTKPETYYQALDGVDAVFLVRPPAVSRVGRHVNPFVDAAARMGVDHVTVLSVLGAEKNPLLPHRRIERHLLDSPLSWTFLRASFFMQNLLEEHRADIVDHDRIYVPAGDGATSFVDARDVAAVAATTLTEPGHGGRAYDLTGPDALTYHEVAAVFSDVLDRQIGYADPSILEFAATMLRRGRSPSFVAVMVAIYTTARLGLAGRVTDDVARVFGRKPRSMRAFVADHAAAFAPADDG